MLSPRNLIELARKWRKIASMRRKRVSFPMINGSRNADSCRTPLAETGKFVIYTTDDQRFAIPLAYLSCKIFIELFKMSEEEFGLPSKGPIKLPCDSLLMEYVISLIKKGLAKDIEKALLASIEASCCSTFTTFHQEYAREHLLVCGY